jgi:DNA-binding transcriptional MerR regulator
LDKAPDAFRTISEVADDLDIPQHVLRFWETRFTQIKPMKRSGGRRYYRPDDVDLLRGIRRLLYGEGYTIRGVQRILKEHGIKSVQGLVDATAAPAFAPAADPRRASVADDHDEEEEVNETEAEDEFDDEDEAEVAPPVVVRREPAMQRREPEIVAQPRLEPVMRAHERVVAVEPPARPAPQPVAVPRLPRDTAKLKAALNELIVCRQILDAAIKDG